MHVKALFPTQYLGAHDLHNGDAVLTIRRVVVEELKTEAGTERKPVVYFKETQNTKPEKRLVLNKTNAMQIAELHGTEVDLWAGKLVALFPTTCAAFGKTVDCIRIRPTTPKKKEN